MPSLDQVQDAMAAALRGGDAHALRGLVADDGIGVEARLGIYRNHMRITLADTLKANFPVTCELVGEQFFAGAADKFIAAELPAEPSLSAYGASFPDFLGAFPACRGLPYLPEVARLEANLNAALHAPPAEHLPLSILASFVGDQSSELVMTLHPSWRLLHGEWPMDRIWLAHQPGGSLDSLADIAPEATWLECFRVGDRFAFRRLSAADFAFREALASGKRLEEVTEAALAIDCQFDLPVTLRTLFDDCLVVSCDLALNAGSEEV